jgi:hypothetical protein
VPDDLPADDTAAPPIVLARLVGAGIAEDRARTWITNGGARVDGEPVTDPDMAAPLPARVVLFPA